MNVLKFYSLSDPYKPCTPYQVSFGDSCFVNITSLLPGGAPVKLDSINHYIMGYSGCVTLCYRYPDTTGTPVTENVAEACINCLKCNMICKPNTATTDTINPFVNGMENNWHPYQNWVYYTKRKPTNTDVPRTRNDGNYSTFTPFWRYNATSKLIENNSAADLGWTKTNKVTLINGSGADIENQDALNNYSSALYSFNESLPKAIASNAPRKDIANDNFEDYGYKSYFNKVCVYEHWDFKDQLSSPNNTISTDQAHTGNNSLKLLHNSNIVISRPIISYTDGPVLEKKGNAILLFNGCMNYFSPDTGKYVISAWVKEDTCCNSLNYSNNKMEIYYTDSGSTFNIYPSGKIIEGWQRYSAEFTVPSSATQIHVKFLSTGSFTCYFDDIRIHLVKSNMKGNVYDNRTLRLMAQLDENNYATFYEYDDQGILIRQKKETEEGIITLQESRNSYVKH